MSKWQQYKNAQKARWSHRVSSAKVIGSYLVLSPKRHQRLREERRLRVKRYRAADEFWGRRRY